MRNMLRAPLHTVGEIAGEPRPVTSSPVQLKRFSLDLVNSSFGLTILHGRLLRLTEDTVTILTLGHLARRKYS